MRAWVTLIASIGMVVVAYAADRVIVVAWQNAGAFPETARTAVGMNVIVGAAVVALMVGLGWLVLRGPRDRGVGLAMLAIGLYASLVLPLGIVMRVAFPFALDAFELPSHLLRLAGTVVAVLGLVQILPSEAEGPSAVAGAGPMRGWWAVPAGLVLIGLAYPGDRILADAWAQLPASGSAIGPAMALDTLLRFAAVTALLAIGWLAYRGQRGRLPGALMVAIGLAVSVVLPLLGPNSLPVAYLVAVVGAAVAAIGLVQLLLPTASSTSDAAGPNASATEANARV